MPETVPHCQRQLWVPPGSDSASITNCVAFALYTKRSECLTMCLGTDLAGGGGVEEQGKSLCQVTCELSGRQG